MKWKNKKVGLSLLASMILLSSLICYQFALSSVPASGPYYLDIPFGDASYYVGKFDNGTTYMIDGDTWQCAFWSTNSSAVANAAVGNLTHTCKEVIVFRGNLTFLNPIQVENFTVLDLYGAQLNLGANVNLIETANDDNVHSFEFHGGVLHGWDYTGDAIHINVTQDLQPSWRNIISDITIKYFVGDGLSLYGAGGRSLVSDLYIYNCTRGVYANSPDGKFTNVVVGDSGKQAWYVSGSSNMISCCKGYGSGYDGASDGSGIIFYGRNIHVFGSMFQENRKYGAEITSSATAISMTGCVFDRNSLNGPTNTYDGVYIAGTNVSITGGEVKNLYGKSQTQRHGVYVKSTASNVKIQGVIEHNLLGLFYHIEDGATDILIDSPQIEATVTVFRDGDVLYTQTQNGVQDRCDATSASATLTLLNTAFGYLTTDRTYKETIVFQGNITSNKGIEIFSYTRWEVQGYLKMADSQNGDFIINGTANAVQIEICGGGVIDPNGAGQSGTSHGIYFQEVNYASIHDLTIKGGYGTSNLGDSIRFADCKFGRIYANYFEKYSVSYDDVKLRGSGSLHNNVYGNVFNATAGGYSASVQISNEASRNSVTSNVIYIDGGSASAIKLHDADYNLIASNQIYMYTDVYGCIDVIEDGDYNTFQGNKIYGAERGIWFREIPVEHPTWNVIQNNYIVLRDWDGAVGVELEDTDNTVVQGNTIICSGTTGTQKGIFVESGCTDTLVEINYFDTQLDANVDNDAGTETYIVNGTHTGGYELNFP